MTETIRIVRVVFIYWRRAMHKELFMMIGGTILFGTLVVTIPLRLFSSPSDETPVVLEQTSRAPREEEKTPLPENQQSPGAILPLDDRPYLATQKDSAWLASIVQPDIWPLRDFNVAEPTLTASSALVMLAGSEKVLLTRNAEQRLPVASITKLLTALTALEEGEPEMALTVSEEALAEEGDSAIFAKERFTLAQLVIFALLPSSNDAAKEIWLTLGKERFTEAMNAKARALGMRDSFFPNASGLHEPGHYSTARDVAILTKAVMAKEFLVKTLGLGSITLTSASGREVTLHNSNKLLDKVPRLLWGKTGFTPEAKGTLTAVTEEGESQTKVIFVVLGSDDRFGDMENLIDWTRRAYKF